MACPDGMSGLEPVVFVAKTAKSHVDYEFMVTCWSQPHFDYCSVVWESCSKGTLSETTKSYRNRAARIITSNYDRNTDELLLSLNWYKLEHQRAVSKLIMM